jgi:hypothetical protein
MNKLINEEIRIFKLISNYDTSKTLTDNENALNESRGYIKNLAKMLETEKAFLNSIFKEAKFTKYLENGKILDKFGNELKTIDEVILAIRNKKMKGKDLAKFNFAVYKTTGNTTLKQAIIKDIISEVGFAKKYINIGEKEFIKDLKKLGYTDDEAKKLINEFKKTEAGKNAETARKKFEFNQKTEKQKQDLDIKIDQAKAEKEINQRRLDLQRIKDSSPSKVKVFLETNGVVRFVKKLGKWTIGNKWFWILGGGTLAGYWMWRNWAKVQGYVEDLLDPWDETSGDDGAVADGVVAGANSDVIGGGNDQEKPIVYKNCSPDGPFKKGSKDYLGGEKEITALQKVLGLPTTGEFDTTLENEVVGRYGNNTLTRDELYGILGVI